MTAAPAFSLVATLLFGDVLSGYETRPRHLPVETFWRDLDAPTTRARAEGIIVLRTPIDGHVRIAGGRFVMGSTASEMQRALDLCAKEAYGVRCGATGDEVGPWIRAEGHAHEVTLSSFELDRIEVTVGRYARCAAAGACARPGFLSGDARFDTPNFPVTHVRWEDANAYCTWIGGRLPTEAEWEFAASGRAGHDFPWGNIYSPRLANHGAWADDPTDGRDGFVGLAPVGSFPDGATATGLYDMAGNAAEWVSDFYDRDEEGYGYKRAAQVNPKGATSSAYGHVVRGGSYREAAHWQRAAARRTWPFAARDIGFRCAYDVEELPAPVVKPGAKP